MKYFKKPMNSHTNLVLVLYTSYIYMFSFHNWIGQWAVMSQTKKKINDRKGEIVFYSLSLDKDGWNQDGWSIFVHKLRQT